METFAIKNESREMISLKNHLNKIILNYHSMARENGNRLLNEIHPEFTINTDTNVLSMVFSKLFSSLLKQCFNCDIRLTAKGYHSLVVIHITMINGFQGVHEVEEINVINLLAEKLGGCLLYNNQHLKESTFSLSILNFDKLAA